MAFLTVETGGECPPPPSESFMKPYDPLLHLMYPNRPLWPLSSLASPQCCFPASNFLTPCLHFYTLSAVSLRPLQPSYQENTPPPPHPRHTPTSVAISRSVANAPSVTPIPFSRSLSLLHVWSLTAFEIRLGRIDLLRLSL